MTIVKVIMNVSAKRVTFQVPLLLAIPNIIAAENSIGSNNMKNVAEFREG